MVNASRAMSLASAWRNSRKSGLRPMTSSSGWAMAKPVSTNSSSRGQSWRLAVDQRRARGRGASGGLVSIWVVLATWRPGHGEVFSRGIGGLDTTLTMDVEERARLAEPVV